MTEGKADLGGTSDRGVVLFLFGDRQMLTNASSLHAE